MNIGRAELHWVALRSLGTFARVVGETPQGEPIVAAGSDRLVLRGLEPRFWLAGRCARCGVERRRAPHPGLGRHRKRALSEWGQVLVVLVLLACFLVLVAVLSSVGTPLTGR